MSGEETPAVAPPDDTGLMEEDGHEQQGPQHNKWSKNGYGNPVEKQTGKFSKEESEIVRKAVKEFCASKQISTSRLCSECDHKAELKGAWMEIAKALPHRSVQSVYRHGIRQLHPFKRGAWDQEEVALLVELVGKHGKKWSTIQGQLHRSADSCRDKYREMSDEYTKGRCQEQETEVLKRLIREQLGVDQNMPMVDVGKMVEEQNIQVPWSAISKRMVKRSRLSCFKKWQKLTGLFPEENTKKEGGRPAPPLGQPASVDESDKPRRDEDPAPPEEEDPVPLPSSKRVKLEEANHDDPNATGSYAEAPTAGVAAALAAAATHGGSGSGGRAATYFDLYDSSKIADETIEAVGLPDTDSLVPSGSGKIAL